MGPPLGMVRRCHGDVGMAYHPIGATMKFSSYNWPHKGECGWVIGPFFGRTLYITIRRWSDK